MINKNNKEVNKTLSLMERVCGVKILSESIDLLLEAMSIDDVYNKYYSKDIESDDFKKIVAADPTTPENQSKAGKFVKWMMNLYKSGGFNMGELEDVTKALNGYTKFYSKLPQEAKDINKFKTLDSLYDALSNFGDGDEMFNKRGELKKNASKQIKKNTNVFYEDDEWKIVVPKTKAEAIALGRECDGSWCTSANSKDNRFDSYNKRGPLYIITNKKSGDAYQLHVQAKEFMNMDNMPENLTNILPIKILNKIPNIEEMVLVIDGAMIVDYEYGIEILVDDNLYFLDKDDYINPMVLNANKTEVDYIFFIDTLPSGVKNHIIDKYKDSFEATPVYKVRGIIHDFESSILDFPTETLSRFHPKNKTLFNIVFVNDTYEHYDSQHKLISSGSIYDGVTPNNLFRYFLKHKNIKIESDGIYYDDDEYGGHERYIYRGENSVYEYHINDYLFSEINKNYTKHDIDPDDVPRYFYNYLIDNDLLD